MVDRVDTVVNVVESEKCALDMSSYEDLHSSVVTNVGSDGDGDGKEDYVFVHNNDVVSLDDHAKNGENVVGLSVEGGDSDNVGGGLETDRLEDDLKVKVDETGLEIENGVNEVEENGDIRSVENGGSDSNVDVSGKVLVVKENSDREIIVDEVKEGSDREPNLDEVSEGSGREPAVNLDEVKEDRYSEPNLDDVREGSDREPNPDEVKEGSGREPTLNLNEVKQGSGREPKLGEDREGSDREPNRDKGTEGSFSEHVVDGVKESGNPKPVLGEIEEAESGFETSDSGIVSVYGIGCWSSDVDGNSKGSVSDVQESALVEMEDITAVSSIPDAAESSEIKEIESGFENNDNGNASVDDVVSHSPDVEDNNKDSVSDAPEFAAVETEDIIAVNGVYDLPKPSEVKEVEVGFETSNHGIGSLSSDVNNNDKDGVSDSQESAEVGTEVSTPVPNIPDVPEPYEIKEAESGFDASSNGIVSGDDIGSCSLGVSHTQESAEVATEDFTAVITPEPSVIKEVELHFEKIDNDVSCDEIGSHSSEVDNNSEDNVSDAQKSAQVATEDIIVVNRVPDVPEPSEVDVQQVDTATAEVSEVELETNQQIVPPLENEFEIHEEKVGLTENKVDHEIKSSVSELESDDSQAETEPLETGVSEKSVENELTQPQPQKPELEPLDVPFHTTHKSVVASEPETVDGSIKSEMMAETGQSQEALAIEGVLQDQIYEQAGSFDVVDKDFSSEDCSTEKTLMVEDTTDLLKLKSTGATPMDADQSNLSDSHTKDTVSESRVVTASDEPSPRDSKIVGEREVVDVSSVANKFPRGSAIDTCSQTETLNSEIDGAVKSNNVSDGTLRPNISFGSFGSSSPLSRTDINLQSDSLNKSTPVSMISSKTKLYSANGVTSLNSHANGDHVSGLGHDTTACVEFTRPEQTNERPVAPSEGSDSQNNNPDFARGPFCWLIKIPKGDEEKYRELLRESEIELAEKTKTRNAFQAEFTKHQAYCRELRSTLEAAKLEARAALDLMRAKRREVDSGQYLINLARRAVTVEDVDNQRLNLEHRLQHETHTLRAERELVREIRHLNHQRQQLSADPQRQEEVQQALNQRDQTGEQLKVLKKELDALRDSFSKADEQVRAAQKKHDDEIVLLHNLRHQVITANDIRQEAYARALMLKKQQYQKSAPFYQARNDLRVAYNFAAAGNKDSLERHCSNQVEKIMEMWNKNDEFRKEYIESNKRRMLWKFGTLDGTQLGINEMPPSMEDISGNRVRISAQINAPTAISAQIISPTAVLPVRKELPIEAKIPEDKITVKKNEDILKNSIAIVSRSVEIEEDKEEPKPTKEEEELARKTEQLRKEEEAARLREQRKLEEKAKAEEALERKRRNALKAQARAEFKAQKEAEEKEIRAKKKQMKGINVNTTEIETGEPSEPFSESVNEPEVAEKPATVGKRLKNASSHTKQNKTAKSIPPALRNKGKRGLLRYWHYACIVLLAIGLFYLGSFERIQAIMQLISGLLHR